MADITIEATFDSSTARGMRGLVYVTPLQGYSFFVDSDDDFKYRKTTDGGATWGATVTIFTGTVTAFDVWFDQWTVGNYDSIIHIWWIEVTNDLVAYKSLNITNDTLGSQITVFDGVSDAAGRGVFVSGARMRGGNLLCCFDIDAGVETGTYRSTDNGATWEARTNLVEATVDQALVFPGNEADNQDGWFLYHDADANELTLKVHDDSANTNSESAVIMALTENTTDGTGQYGFSGAIRFSDGHLIIVAWTEYDTTTADFVAYDINGTGSITALTNLATNIQNSYYPSIFIDQKTNNIYVAYIGKSDGSETLSQGVYYAKSTDNGITWSMDNALSASTGTTWSQTWSSYSGFLFAVSWRNSTLTLLTNFDNSVQVGYINSFNNYQFASTKSSNAGILSVSEKIR